MFGLPEHMSGDLLAVFLFGVVATVVVTVGTLFLDWLYRRVNLQEEVKKGNLSAGILLGSVVLGLSFVMGMTVKAITSGH